MKKYLIPPRLNGKLLNWGLTFTEWLYVIVSLLIAVMSKQLYLLIIPAFIFATCVRFIDREMNIWQYGKKVYNYFFKPQSYSITGGERMGKKTEDIEELLTFSIRENHVEAKGFKYYFYRFYPPNISILTPGELENEISSLCSFFETANMPIQIFAMDKIEDLSRNKKFFENMDEKYKQYTEKIVEQISSHDTNDERTNSVQRAYYFVIRVRSEDDRNNFEDAIRNQNLRHSLVDSEELITVFRNYYLREFSAFNVYVFGEEVKNKYGSASK